MAQLDKQIYFEPYKLSFVTNQPMIVSWFERLAWIDSRFEFDHLTNFVVITTQWQRHHHQVQHTIETCQLKRTYSTILLAALPALQFRHHYLHQLLAHGSWPPHPQYSTGIEWLCVKHSELSSCYSSWRRSFVVSLTAVKFPELLLLIV